MPASKNAGRAGGLRGRMLCVALLLGGSAPCLSAEPLETSPSALQAASRHAAAQPRPAMIAREMFVRQPEVDSVRLAPDGRHLSFLKHGGKGSEVWLQEVATGKRSRVLADADGIEHVWSGDGRRLWLADAQGLAVFDSADGTAKRILKWDGARRQRFWGVDAQATAFALVSETLQDKGVLSYRYLLVDTSGATRLLHQSARPLRRVLLTQDGRLAFAAAYDGSGYDTVVRQYGPEGAREIARCIGIETCHPVAYSPRSGDLWMLAHGSEDRLGLRRWQSATGRWQTVHQDPEGIADADMVLWNRSREDWQAIAYHRDRRHWYGKDGSQSHLAALERHLPDASLQLSPSANGRVWLVRAERSDWPLARHFLYQPERDRLHPLFVHDDAVLALPIPQDLARAQPVTWRASDGMLLHGYVYLPLGLDPAKAPIIAWLHGGPFGRMDGRYDARFQLLANRGYVVFLPNFRASTGYGLGYLRAAKGDVGNGRVLQDAIDGLDFLIEHGIGDRERQAVTGHSFGGYASLVAASHHPGRFRFAFAGAASTDYGWMKQWQTENESEALRGDGAPVALSFPQHGLPVSDPAWRRKMQRESPLAAVAALRTPVYLWAGARDDRVPIKSVVHYAGEAQRLGKSITLLIDPGSGHNPRQPLNAEAWLYLMEHAAHRHFGGGESPVSSELRAFLRENVRIDTQRAPGTGSPPVAPGE